MAGVGSLPLAIGLLVLAVLFLFTIPWVGMAVGVIALVLLVVALVGGSRTPREDV
jgi:hypothetical protein